MAKGAYARHRRCQWPEPRRQVVGADVRGLTVHETSRILGLCEPDEVLVPSLVAGLARESDLTYEDRGEHQLRGLAGSYRLAAVTRAKPLLTEAITRITRASGATPL